MFESRRPNKQIPAQYATDNSKMHGKKAISFSTWIGK